MLFRHGGPAAPTARVVLCLVLLAAPAAAEEPARNVDVRIGAGAAAAGAAPSFPPCIDVRFTADGVSGRPPLAFSWLSDTGEQLAGNPVDLDTTAYAVGQHQLTLTVSNDWGQDVAVAPFEIEPLTAGLPTAPLNPVPGLQATVEGSATGYNEWRFVWGDGQASPWQQGCIEPSSHTYAAAGTYLVRLETRNCLEAPVESSPLPLTVGGTNLQVTEFEADCQYGVCASTAGATVTFLQDFTLPPALVYYDWDGNGTTDEISALPVTLHTYPTPGFYRPKVSAEWGTQSAERTHSGFVRITSDPEPYVFYDGFESGDGSCWSEISGAPPGSPGPDCFGVE